MDSYIWTQQGWLTSKVLHTSALCGHWIQPRGPGMIETDGKRESGNSVRSVWLDDIYIYIYIYVYILIYIYIYIYKIKLVTIVEGDMKVLFLLAIHWGLGEGATPFLELFHFTLYPHFIMLSVKQGGIVPFLSLWYDMTWDRTPVSLAIDEHTTHLANGLVFKNY